MDDTTEKTIPITDEVATAPVPDKTLTQADFDKIFDKRYAKIEAKHKEELEKARQDALTEGQKLAKMSADERAKHDFEERMKELAEREQKLTKGELRAEALQQLGEKGLPRELAEVLPYVDADSTMAALESVEKVFRAAVEKGVTERLKANPPKVGQPVPVMAEVDKLTAQYEAAIKAGNTVEAVALKNKLFKLEQK